MKIRELFEDKFLDWVENTSLLEMAWSRKDAERKISGLAVTIIEHLVKVLKWNSGIDHNKHCKDITNFLKQVQDITLKNGKKPEAKTLYQWMMIDLGINDEKISNIINYKLYLYYDTIIRSDKEVYTFIVDIMTKVVIAIEKDQFRDINDYF